MKTIYCVFIALAIFIADTGVAAETPKMSLNFEKDRILVDFKTETPCPVEITVTDNNGDVVYYWQSESAEKSVNHRLKTKELGNGTFTVALKYGCRSINRELCINRKEVKVGPAVQMYEPFFCFENDKLNVSFFNVSNKNVYLNIYKNGNHYDGFKLGKDMDIQKSLDFSMAEEGNYEVVLTDYFKDHHYMISK